MVEEEVTVDTVDTPEIARVAHFFSQVLNFLRENSRDEEICCMILTETAGGNFWMNGMVTSKIWETGMLEMANTVNRGRMYHHIAATAKMIHTTTEEAKLRAVPVKGKAQ